MQNEMTVQEAISSMEKVAAALRRDILVDLPSSFEGLTVQIDGVTCQSYTRGYISLHFADTCRLPSSQLEAASANLQEACNYRLAVIKAAEAIALRDAARLHGRLWRHDGTKFVRV